MLANIYDKRTNKYDVNCHVVAEHSAHDNSIKGATKFSWDDENECRCDCLHNTTIASAVAWANDYKCPVTLYIYDQTETLPCGCDRKTKNG